MAVRRDLSRIFLLAALAYGWSLFYPIADAHSFRQTWTASTVRLFAREGTDLLQPRVDYVDLAGPQIVALELPVYQAIVAHLYRLLGEHEALGRLVSAACGLGAAVTQYPGAREVGRTARLSVFEIPPPSPEPAR